MDSMPINDAVQLAFTTSGKARDGLGLSGNLEMNTTRGYGFLFALPSSV